MPENSSVESHQAQLLRRIAEQDRSALAELYDQTAPALFAFAVRVLGNPHDAEEVIQDVFVQVWNKAVTFDPAIGQAFHWAMSIARNRCIDRLRARQRRSRVLVELEEGVEPEAPAETRPAEATTFGDDEAAAIRSAVGGLPADQRQAIELAFFGGLTHQEIAARLGEPLGTIKARIRRGMMKLREHLRAFA
jgi:RNA polymerase sigma-70 factor (ECF subfamily)